VVSIQVVEGAGPRVIGRDTVRDEFCLQMGRRASEADQSTGWSPECAGQTQGGATLLKPVPCGHQR